MTLREGYLWRWSHARHHTHTYIVGRDPEIQVTRPADLLKIAMDFFYLRSGPPEVWRIIRNAAGRPDSNVRDFMPEDELQKMYWSSRVYVAIVGGVALYALAIGSFLPMMFVALPRFYGGWLHQLLGLTQHAGLGEDTYDHRENTRTVYVNPVFAYLYMNMQYHLEHHSTPMIPYHALPKYHATIKDQTPTAYPNLWAVYKEMLPALYKQATQDPDYHIVREIPAHARTKSAETVEAVSAAGDWVEVCAVTDLAEQDVMGFEHNGNAYALYRLAGNAFYASDGYCTHEQTLLSGGLVIDGCIECPMHNGRFNVETGAVVRRPAKQPLRVYPAELRGDTVFVQIQ
jgi:MocE subfamily Rieske [2Fe-2S] domain protein